MKNLIPILIVILFCSTASIAQDVIRQSACTQASILQQADSIKKELAKQGFIIVKEASMSMQSEYEMPVLLPLIQGSWYQFIFIGDRSSKPSTPIIITTNPYMPW